MVFRNSGFFRPLWQGTSSATGLVGVGSKKARVDYSFILLLGLKLMLRLIYSGQTTLLSVLKLIFIFSIQDKLGELQALVMQLLGEKHMLHSYHEEATGLAATPRASPALTNGHPAAKALANGQHADYAGDHLYIFALLYF